MPDRIQNLKDSGLFLRPRLAACLWELRQIIYSQRKTGLTWQGSQEWLQSYIIWGIRASSELKGPKWPAVVMAIVTSQTWLQVSSERRRGAVGRRQGHCPCWGSGFSACFTPLYSLCRSAGQGQTTPAPWGSGSGRNKQLSFCSFTAPSSLFHAQTRLSPWKGILSACRTKSTHFQLWF